MKSIVRGCAVGLLSIIGAGVALAGDAGVYDGKYQLDFSDTHVLVNCAFSNFAGELLVSSPRHVVIPEGGALPDAVVYDLEDETLQFIEDLDLQGYPARLAVKVTDAFYDEFQRAVAGELDAYPDWMAVTMSDPVEQVSFLYRFDALLWDDEIGWEDEAEGVMGTYEGVFALEPVFEYDYDSAFDATMLGVSAATQMAGVVSLDGGALRWATRLVAINPVAELILGCSASGVAPFEMSPEGGAYPEPQPTPAPTGRSATGARTSWFVDDASMASNLEIAMPVGGLSADAEASLMDLDAALRGGPVPSGW